MIAKYLDFAATEEKASRMTVTQLHYAIWDCLKTLAGADSLDIETGEGWRGGYYRDEISVYRQELAKRS